MLLLIVRIEPPSECALLVENTEVHIKPMPRNVLTAQSDNKLKNGHIKFLENISNNKETSVDPPSTTNSENSILRNFVSSLSRYIYPFHKMKIENFGDQLGKNIHFIEIIPCRVLAVERFVNDSKTIKCWSTEHFKHMSTSEVYIFDEYLRSKVKSVDFSLGQKSFLAIMRKLQDGTLKDKEGKHKKMEGNPSPKSPLVVESVVVRVNLVSTNDFAEELENCFQDSILVPECLRLVLDVDLTSRVTLETLDNFKLLQSQPPQITITPLFQPPNGLTADMMEIAVCNYFESLIGANGGPIILNNGEVFECFLKLAQGKFVIRFLETNGEQSLDGLNNKFCFLSSEGLSLISLKIDIRDSFENSLGKFYSFAKQSIVDDSDSEDSFITKANRDIIEEIKKFMKFCIHCHKNGEHHIFRHGGMILTGPRGSGKTTFCDELQRSLQVQAKTFYVKFIDCNDLSGKAINSLNQTFANIFDELFLRRPSLLILDHLDSIASNYTKEEAETSQRALLHTQIAQMIVHNVTRESYNNGFNMLLATAESFDKLHPIFTERLFFTQQYKIAGFKSNYDRMNFMKKCIADVLDAFDKDNKPQDCTTNTLSTGKLDSCVTQDIKIIAKQVVMQALSRGLQSHLIEITDEDVNSILDKYVPLQLRHSVLSTPPSVCWSDVGALQDAKNSLIETFLWPTKYPQIFKNYPLPLRKGALLYGAPGTGKTLLASAAASECKLNLICIKGPELLSKFIGASEKAVRETFSNARSARPCIIFFDELDSLAPRRGHDNTGVTDRVVNQLLAEMDGVEQLEGVFILAATSRPDLIDPALLRPGRLDRFLFCPIPGEVARREILTTLAREVNLSEDVSLDTLAQLTRDFTGADLKALIYNALLESLNSLEEFSDQSPLIVSQHHITSALRSTKPSLNQRDRRFYDQIYTSFAGGSKQQTSAEGIGQKTTLA